MYHDHHFHPLGYARLVNGLELYDAADIGGVLALVAAHAGRADGPVIGQRLNDESLAERRLPTRFDIDDRLERLVVDVDQVERVVRQVRVGRDEHRDRLPHVPDPLARQRVLDGRFQAEADARLQRRRGRARKRQRVERVPEVFERVGTDHPRARSRPVEADARDPRVGMRAPEDRGVEADECYVFGPDPRRKRRPDVAIEVVWTWGGIDKLNVYRKLGVREVWYWVDGRIQVHVLRGTRYAPVAESEALPGIDLVLLVSFLDRPTASRAIRDYRGALRGE